MSRRALDGLALVLLVLSVVPSIAAPSNVAGLLVGFVVAVAAAVVIVWPRDPRPPAVPA